MHTSRFYARLLASFVFALLLVTVLVPNTLARLHTYKADAVVGAKQYYLALGDSLAFGYQPNLDFSHGYVDDFSTDLQTHGSTETANLGCPGETSSSFINGGCRYAALRKFSYQGDQLSAAVLYLTQHQGQVSPVTLDIGANDMLPDLSSATCVVSTEKFNADLAAFDTNLTQNILPRLRAALTVNGVVTGDLLVANYYDPYQNMCPNTVPFVQELNSHIAADVQGSGTVVDVFSAFGGATTPNPNACMYTWICDASYHDIHSTTQGYGVIAQAFEQSVGY
ncbi:MAG: hypothetical protein NVSMB44_04840 [Ktedonobacteraceae bacterium]